MQLFFWTTFVALFHFCANEGKHPNIFKQANRKRPAFKKRLQRLQGELLSFENFTCDCYIFEKLLSKQVTLFKKNGSICGIIIKSLLRHALEFHVKASKLMNNYICQTNQRKNKMNLPVHRSKLSLECLMVQWADLFCSAYFSVIFFLPEAATGSVL